MSKNLEELKEISENEKNFRSLRLQDFVIYYLIPVLEDLDKRLKEVKTMDIKEVDRFIRNECLSYQLPKDKQQFDNEKGEVLDFIYELWDYRLMWEDFSVNEGDLVKVVNCIKHRYEQKYFPKPKKKEENKS